MVENLDTKIYLSLIGGGLIGLSSSLNYILFGKITGLSGYMFKVLSLSFDRSFILKLSFLTGLVSAVDQYNSTFGKRLLTEQVLDEEPAFNPILLSIGALLVGIGVRWGGGCTSGHGVCGLPRLSRLSFIAVPVFMLTGILTATLLSKFPEISPVITVSDSFKSDYYNYFTATFLILIQCATVVCIGFNYLKEAEIVHKVSPVLYLITGAIFGIGLLVSGMCSRVKILAFLTLSSNWDPSLMFVMASAVGINFITFQTIMKRKHAVFDSEIDLPDSDMHKGVFFGPALFGVGWGITGLCPGPALANFTVLSFSLFTVAFIYSGQYLTDYLVEKMNREPLIKN